MTDLSLNPEIPVITPDAAPDQPVKHPIQWIKENLFSSVSNTVQTFLFAFILMAILRWLLGLIVSEERDWTAVTTNMRLLFTYNYPASQYGRIWFSLASLLIAAMLTVAAFGLRPVFSLRKLLINVSGTGAFFILIGVLAPVKFESKLPLLIPGLIILAIGVGLLVAIDNPHLIKVKFWQLLCGIAVLLLAVIWFFPFGNNTFVGGEVVQIPGTIKQSTKNWLSLMVGITVAAFFFARWLATVVPNRPFRLIMMVWWVLGPAFLIFLVIRDPAFDWGYVVSVDIPIALLFGVGGGALLFWLAKPGREPIARAVGTAILGLSALTFVLAFTGDLSMLQKVRLSILALGFVALLAPTFAGETKVRLRFALTWLALVAITHWLITGINTPSTLDIAAPPFLGGFAIPMTLGYYVMLASFPMGMLMALARTSTLPLFRLMSTIYIEGVRGVPLIVILFFFDNLLNLFLPDGMAVSKLAAIFIGYTLFSAAYMAENIRGGLQSVRRGQFEASDALGLTTLQRTVFIILPQALRVSIPNLVGQAIATFKETSLVAIIGAFDLLNVARNSIPNQPAFLGHSIAPLLFISMVYWVVAYSMSRASRSLETHLGVGTR
jgi:general L-amino acid transport system permease protein